ncbi:hypothetical protein FKW77_010067 [Venturia effusa]|uniref:Uncharacterized protein n=1 Tax=Venturia effusa TaxID=50376 RepID=A0A517L6A2_9PEZI|nr:hypothetical protein FKW77_010067 [Venturia effusa]
MFNLRKRFTKFSSPASSHPVASRKKNTQQKSSLLKRLTFRKPHQQQGTASEDTQLNDSASTTTVQPAHDAVALPNEPRNNSSSISQPSAHRLSSPFTIRRVSVSPDGSVEGSITHQANSLESGSVDKDSAVWQPIFSLPGSRIEALAMRYAPSNSIRSARIIHDTRGRNDRVAVIQYEPSGDKCIIRMPVRGWVCQWTEDDKVTFERIVETMIYLKAKTNIPIPSIRHYGVDISGILGAPYMITECIEGKHPLDLWWREESDNEVEGSLGGFYKKVSPQHEETRQRILKSIAFNMAELRSFAFDQLGTFAPNKKGTPPTIEPIAQIPGTPEYVQTVHDNRKHRQSHTFDSSREWLESNLARFCDMIPQSVGEQHIEHVEQHADLVHGIQKLYKLIIPELPVTNPDVQERFVIGLPDFGSQNILVDGEGNVTGIVDWEVVETRPQYLGWTTLPNWLFRDLTDPNRYSHSGFCMTPFEHMRYQEDYVNYLREACGSDSDGWKYSTKNYMYTMIVESIASLDRLRMTDTLMMVLSAFMPAHIQFKAFIKEVGKSDQLDERLEGYLKDQFTKLLRHEEQNVVQGDRLISGRSRSEQMPFNTNIFDQPLESTSMDNPAQMITSKRQQEQSQLRPQACRRAFGEQNMNSSIPGTSEAIPTNKDYTTEPISDLPPFQDLQKPLHSATNARQLPVVSTAPNLSPPIPETRTETTKEQSIINNHPSASSQFQSQPMIQDFSSTLVQAQCQRQIPGEWPLGENINMLHKVETVPSAEVPLASVENIGTRRTSLEIKRMASAWPVDGSGDLLCEPEEGCVAI